MRTLMLCLISVTPGLTCEAAAAEQTEMPAVDRLEALGFRSLFNGRDLTGWKIPVGDNGHWKVVDGVIDYDALSESKQNKNLLSESDFGDFTLYLEWRFKRTAGMYPVPTILADGSYKMDADGKQIVTLTPNADSGLLLRGVQHQVNLWCWPIGSGELWSVRNNQKLTAEQRAAAVPKACADKPVGQWNQMMVTMDGDRVTVVLNGVKVIDNAQIPGIQPTGPIGFQHHGGRLNEKQIKRLKDQNLPVDPEGMNEASSLVQFRNVYIKQ
ncbi:MAG: DUF1080 domain-containing protein [Planctomycetes bacterium]|nr:DUF1080 domain-containing protein [Planctomycetota bacterium]